jgi:hypothetical protein
VLATMRDAYLAFLDGYRLTDRAGEFARIQKLQGVIRASSTLTAYSLKRARAAERELAGHVALRMGVDQDIDPRPRFAVAAWEIAMQIAFEESLKTCVQLDLDTCSEAVHAAYALVGNGANYPSATAGAGGRETRPPTANGQSASGPGAGHRSGRRHAGVAASS